MSNYTILKYKQLEIYCKNGTIDKYREGNISYNNTIVTDNIYTDVKKGNLAKTSDLQKIFNTDNIEECVKIMLENGDYSLTTAEKRQKTEDRRREIINYLTKNYTDTKNNKLTVDIIDEILKKIKITIDPHINGNKQARDLVRKFTNLYPIKKISQDGTVIVPNYLQTKTQNLLSKYCDICSKYNIDDSLYYDVSIAPSDFDNLMNLLQKTTNGDYQFNLPNESSSNIINTKKKKKRKD